MKSIGLILFGAIAVFSGVAVAIMLIRKKRRDDLLDFDDFDTAVSDEEFEHFFGVESGGSEEDEESDS
ncbi:MAG: hypothetical protein FWG83_05855 [Oscillospiraceae bacterium]|nr:hypothetical protein [Oscillospiraceae bacterium]